MAECFRHFGKVFFSCYMQYVLKNTYSESCNVSQQSQESVKGFLSLFLGTISASVLSQGHFNYNTFILSLLSFVSYSCIIMVYGAEKSQLGPKMGIEPGSGARSKGKHSTMSL